MAGPGQAVRSRRAGSFAPHFTAAPAVPPYLAANWHRNCERERIMMLIQVNTDNHIDGSAELAADVEAVVASTLGHLSARITRVEVHLSDENSHKGGNRDKRCAMEARAEGLQPTAVTHQAATADEAVDGAAEKLKHALETHFGRLNAR